MMTQKASGISRREFARRAALASAVGALLPVNALPVPTPQEAAASPQAPAEAPKLSPQGQAEAEARYEAIVREYAGRFTEEQKQDLRRLCYAAQPGFDRLRAYTIQNGDSPALYLKPLVEREKKPAAVVPPQRKP